MPPCLALLARLESRERRTAEFLQIRILGQSLKPRGPRSISMCAAVWLDIRDVFGEDLSFPLVAMARALNSPTDGVISTHSTVRCRLDHTNCRDANDPTRSGRAHGPDSSANLQQRHIWDGFPSALSTGTDLSSKLPELWACATTFPAWAIIGM